MLRNMTGLQGSQSRRVARLSQHGLQCRTRRRLAVSKMAPMQRLRYLAGQPAMLRATVGACLERASRVDSAKRNVVAIRPSVDNVES